MTGRRVIKNPGARKLSDILHETVASVEKARTRNKSLREKWRNAAGDTVSCHTEAKMVRDGILYVEVDSAVWMHHITAFEKEKLLTAVQSEFRRGYISDINFRIGVF